MPILPSHKNPLALLKGFREELEQRTNITNFDRDSKIRALSDVLVDEILFGREESIEANYAQQLSNAVGGQLDAIGEAMGLARKQVSFANTLSSEQSVAFYVESGDFGSINGGGPIIVPSGTRIYTNPNTNELGATIDYQLTSNVTLAVSDTISFISVEAINAGSKYNVGAETLRSHNFTGYATAASNSLKVVNFYPILNGGDRETDDSYRYRLSQYYNALAQANVSRMKLNALQVPGVVQTKIMPGYYGIGTAGVAVMGPEFQTNTKMINGVQSHLDTIQIPGTRTQAIGATQVSFDFVLEVKPSRVLTTSQRTTLKGGIKRAMLEYFRRRSLGDLVDLQDLARAIQRATNNLVSLDSIGDRRLFKKVWLRRGFPGSSTDERERFIKETRVYRLKEHEFAALGTLEINFI